jgi:hypothetical protein
MSFDALIEKCNDSSIRAFANVDVRLTLSGVYVRNTRGIFDEFSESVSPFEMSQMQIKPTLSIQDKDFAGITSEYTLTINGKNYQFDGKPRPDGHGMTVMYLTGKR